MKENQLAMLAFAFALIGLLVLYWLDANAQPEKASIASLSSQDAGRFVQVTGRAKGAYLKDGNLFLEICEETDCISLVAFEPVARKMSPDPRTIQNGDLLTAKGIVQETEQGLELVISRPDWIQR